MISLQGFNINNNNITTAPGAIFLILISYNNHIQNSIEKARFKQ